MPRSSSRPTCASRQFVGAAILLACGFVGVPHASAEPITLKYEGLFQFYDSFFGPDLVAGFAAQNIFQGAPVTFSMTIDPDAPGLPVGGDVVDYPTGLLAATLRIGSLTYTAQTTYLDSEWSP